MTKDLIVRVDWGIRSKSSSWVVTWSKYMESKAESGETQKKRNTRNGIKYKSGVIMETTGSSGQGRC